METPVRAVQGHREHRAALGLIEVEVSLRPVGASDVDSPVPVDDDPSAVPVDRHAVRLDVGSAPEVVLALGYGDCLAVGDTFQGRTDVVAVADVQRPSPCGGREPAAPVAATDETARPAILRYERRPRRESSELSCVCSMSRAAPSRAMRFRGSLST